MRNGHHPETPPDGSGHTSVALAAEIRRTHTRHLRWLTRTLLSEAGEFQDGLEPVTGLPPWRPPAIEARSVTQRDNEVRVAAGRQPEYGQGEDGDLPAGTTRIRVSVSAHHARTRAPATLGDCEIRAWAVALFDPQWVAYCWFPPVGEVARQTELGGAPFGAVALLHGERHDAAVDGPPWAGQEEAAGCPP